MTTVGLQLTVTRGAGNRVRTRFPISILELVRIHFVREEQMAAGSAAVVVSVELERLDWSKDSAEPHRNDRLRLCFEVWSVSKSASLSATDWLSASAWTLRQLVFLSKARFLTVVLALSCSCALAQQRVGYVLEMEGTWTLRASSQPLSMGQALPRAGLLVNSDPLDNDNIVVANLRGEVIKTIRCRSGVCGECRESSGCY